MKTLIFLLISISCFASGQNQDSLKIKYEELKQSNQVIEQKIKKLEVVEKKHDNAIYRLKIFIKRLMSDKSTEKKEDFISGNREAVKVENQTEPVTEIIIPDGVDSIRGGWIYRLLHKDDFKIKYYKIVGDEKVYLN